MTTPAPDYSAMSDEDFMNQARAGAPVAAASEEQPVVETEPQPETQAAEQEPGAGGAEDAATEADQAIAAAEAAGTDTDPAAEKPKVKADANTPASADDPARTTPHQTAPKPEAAAVAEKEGEKETPPAAAEAAPVDYKAGYERIMGTFKANGKDFTPQSPDEVVRLMQQGANYTQKMQALKPHLKMIRMLENSELLTEEKLTHLIDLSKGDKGAIQKLLKDHQVDPLEIDPNAEPTYKPGDHSVSDAELDFHTIIGEVASTAHGQETLKVINDTWDAPSKAEIAKFPKILDHINKQRSTGVYAKIAAEVDRRRILGELANVPFVAAYKTVGDELHAAGKLLTSPPPAAQPAPAASAQTPQLGTRTTRVVTQAQPAPSARAIARAPGSGNPVAKRTFDPMAMSDDEIMAMKPPKF